jgi:hypothetical protein
VTIGLNAISVANTGRVGPIPDADTDTVPDADDGLFPDVYSVIFGDWVTIENALICVGDNPDAIASFGTTAAVAIGEQCDNATTP